MVYVRNEIDINAPLEEVFAYMDNPAHQADITPSLVKSELIERLPNGGSRASYVYSFLGIKFEGEVQATTYTPNQLIVFDMEGGLEGQIVWTFREHDDGTRVIYEAKYEIPLPVLKKVAEAVAKRYNKREVGTLLANLKDQMESQRTSA